MISPKKARSNKHQVAVWSIVIVSVLITGSYFFAGKIPGRKTVNPPEKVTIAFSVNPNPALAVIALKESYYRQEGLEVSERLHPYGKAALQDVLEGKADFATVAETPVVFAIMKGEKISIVATIQTTGGNNAIIARNDRGIAASPDLKGKRIGVTVGTTAHFFLDAYLSVNGIARKDVKVVDLTQEEAVEALANGAIEAASVFYPYLNKAKKRLGARGIVFSDKNLYMQTFNIVAKQELIERRPETVKKMLRSLVKAEDFLTRIPGEAQKIVADFIRLDLESIRESWADATFAVTLDQSLLLAMEDESEWAIKNKLTDATQVPNYLDYIYFEGLQSVRPEAVGILR